MTMTKKKAVKPAVAHQMYYGNHVQSNKFQRFAKCVCGAVLEGQEAIDEHLVLMDGRSDNKSAGMPRGPSEVHPTKKAG